MAADRDAVARVSITRLSHPSARDLDDLADVLVDCVDGGAGVGFLAPLDVGLAREWWVATLATPNTLTWVARADSGRIDGCVRLILAAQQNAPHRAEVSKLLVTRSARRTGAATALLTALEAWALEHGRTRLVLDSQTGSGAVQLYQRLGWSIVGQIPDFALTTAGEPISTTVMTKSLVAPDD